MALRERGLRTMLGCMSSLERQACLGALNQTRGIGGWVPEYYGKKSQYTEGTKFLGTPADYQQRLKHRPISPDVLTLDNKALHYKLPIQAISSITTRITGVGMSVGIIGAGVIALTGNLPATILYLKSWGPLVTVPLKGLVAFPLVYHYGAGIRHMIWDHAPYPQQNEKTSVLELDEVKKSSEFLLYGSGAVAGLLALYYYTA